MKKKSKPRRWALFVEGRTVLTPNRRVELVDLWHELVSRSSDVPTQLVAVHGFTKYQLVAMGGVPESDSLKTGDASKTPLDALIAATHENEPFDVLVVAFDAHPANQNLQPTKSGKLNSSSKPCQVDEVGFVLKHFAESGVLPDPFKRDSASLLAHYKQTPKAAERPKGRPPRGALDLLYMDPEFEALLLNDDASVRSVFSFPKKPKDWPSLPPRHTDRPKDVLRNIVDRWRRQYGPSHLRDTYDRHPHAWAREIVKKAAATSRLWKHPIAERLSLLLA